MNSAIFQYLGKMGQFSHYCITGPTAAFDVILNDEKPLANGQPARNSWGSKSARANRGEEAAGINERLLDLLKPGNVEPRLGNSPTAKPGLGVPVEEPCKHILFERPTGEPKSWLTANRALTQGFRKAN